MKKIFAYFTRYKEHLPLLASFIITRINQNVVTRTGDKIITRGT